VINFYDGESYAGGRNRFDSNTSLLSPQNTISQPSLFSSWTTAHRHIVTAPCDIDNFCYANTQLLQDYLNLESSFSALSIPKEVKNFTAGSDAVSQAFELTNDLAISMIPQVQYLLASQIDVLIYQGNLDLACNTAGAKRWTANMPWKGQAAFTSLDLKPWKSEKDGKEVVAGMFKEVNVKMVDGDDKTTRFALVTIDGSGHMVCWPDWKWESEIVANWLRDRSLKISLR
jgi:cathepsin A (carboxypeptidase C)